AGFPFRFRLFVFHGFRFLVLAFFGLETFRGHFQPFTDVLREMWPAVTRKVGKIRNRGCRGWILASV
ncbi:MAG: hypothetical protein QOG67_2096, partial [Verrucomicrobiota bacterium]